MLSTAVDMGRPGLEYRGVGPWKDRWSRLIRWSLAPQKRETPTLASLEERPMQVLLDIFANDLIGFLT